MTVRAANIPFSSRATPAADPLTVPQERIFRPRGEQRYSLELLPSRITFEVDRLRRSSQELWGEVAVTIDSSIMPSALHFENQLSVGDLNFSSVNARTTRAKVLSRRSGVERLDWEGFLEEFCIRVISAERTGKPAVIMADIELPSEDESTEVWAVGDFPILRELPMVLFGDSDSGKSYFCTWLAGELARRGEKVLYADWEFSGTQHRKRLSRLFQPMPRSVFYAHCDTPLVHQADRLRRLIQEHGITYGIFDSIGFAVDGPAEAQESARTYFKALRQLGIGSLNVAHIAKSREEGKDPTIFGSTFYRAGARSVWYLDKAETNPPGEIRFGLHQRKNNLGTKLAPRAYRLVFDKVMTRIEPIDIKAIDELSVQLPALDRIRKQLNDGAMTPKAIGEELNLPLASVRSVLSRHKSQFLKVGPKYGLREEGADF